MHLSHLKLPAILSFMISLTACLSVKAADEMTLVSEGKPTAVIITPADEGEHIRRGVAELIACVEKSSGAKLTVEQASQPGRTEIHIGATSYVQSLKLSLQDLGVDGFRIFSPAPGRIVLIGGADSGTEMAVYDFLERFVGVRWLFPGELGTHVPATKNISISVGEADSKDGGGITSRPKIISRTISTVYGSDPGEPVFMWLKRHRNHWTISHHHNLDKLFPSKKYLASHPDFFPMVNGKRVEPDADSQNWQPMFDAPGIVDEAVKNINAYFDENPRTTSYSLGVNDGNNFGVPPRRVNSIGLADYSDYYFGFCNKVIAGVLKTHPDKWFGCLAYVGITDPPLETGVHERLVPYICIDRYGWANEADAQRDRERTINWHKAAPVLGWYDYIYGDDHYRVPRFYPHLMAKYLRFGADQGVKAYYAEYYGAQAWIEGPKMYVLMKLLWDPTADVDAMLEEWYRLSVGDKAAVPLQKYYQFWEDYWLKRVPETDWFKQYAKRQYFDFDHLGYLDPLTEDDLTACGKLMDQVVALAETPEQKQRAQFMSKGFDEVRSNVDYHVRLRDKTVAKNAAPSLIVDESFVPPSSLDVHSPDAAKVASPWGAWQNEPGTAKLYWDHKHGQTDSHCVAVDAEGAGTSVVIYRDFPVEHPRSLHHLSAAVQVNDVNPDAYIGAEVRWTRKDGKYLARKYTCNAFRSAATYPNGKWVTLNVFAKPPADAGELTMNVRWAAVYSKKGTIRFDDLRLSVVDEKQAKPK